MSVQQRRYGWIEACLRYAGAFGRREKAAYVEIFGVSEASMSRHQSDFADALERDCGIALFVRDDSGRLHNGRLTLLESVRLPDKPVFPIPDLDRWLEDTMGNRFERPSPIVRALPEQHIIRTVISAI
jgi:hypothetical protein